MAYGKELILDLHNCDPTTFDRQSIGGYFRQLCKEIGMEACDLHFWDDVGVAEDEKQTDPHTKGTSAIQFILTSSITIHTLELLGKVFVNVFSCKDFDVADVSLLTETWFHGMIAQHKEILRL